MPVPRMLQLTADQELATGQRNLQGVVYLLSGTLPGRADGVSDATFRWATRTFSGAMGNFEAYIRPPTNVTRGQTYLPGGGNIDPGTRIPVRNLEFRGNVSLLAAIDDGVYAWENAEADLRVGYLKPGQEPEDLAAGDWTFLIKRGFFGAPDDLAVDGFTLVLYNRGAKRNQLFKQPLTPTSGEVWAVDRKDLGVPYPVVIGSPDSWYKPPIRELGVRGFTVSGYVQGDTEITFRRITEGKDRVDNTSVRLLLVGEKVGGQAIFGDVWYIHRTSPLYQSDNSVSNYVVSGDLVHLTLVSGLMADVPRGAFVQQHRIAGMPKRGYSWYLAGHHTLGGYQDSNWKWRDDFRGNVGWLLGDGTIKIAEETRYTFENDDELLSMFENMLEFGGSPPSWQSGKGTPPCYFDPSAEAVGVESQPQFQSTQLLSSKLNYPTGGTGVNNAKARDGSEDTYANIGVDGSITLTFNTPPSPFTVYDTTNSVLHVLVNGGPMTFKNSLGSITMGTASGGAGTVRKFRFPQGSPWDYDETVLVGGTGFLCELWWEHDLSTEEDSVRTQDVVISTGSGILGPVMQYAELVFRMPSTKGGYQGRIAGSPGGPHGLQVKDLADQSSEIGNAAGSGYSADSYYWAPYPTQVMLSLQDYFLGATADDVDLDSYAIALQKFKEHDIRLNFVIQEPLNSWTELEQAVALQSRSHMFYGPSGHQIVFMDVASGIAASGVVQEFRLAGTPGANTVRAGRALMERQGVSEIANAALGRYNRDYVEGGEFRDNEEATNAESVALFGEVRDPRTGDYQLWAHSPYRTHPTYSAADSVLGIMQHYADRGAFAVTRFNFDTGWLAHGLDRGSPVRVSYEVAPGEYRNVVCEVEEVGVSPLNSERFTLRCRAMALPSLGLAAVTWADVFTSDTDKWTSELGPTDTWADRWSIS